MQIRFIKSVSLNQFVVSMDEDHTRHVYVTKLGLRFLLAVPLKLEAYHYIAI